MATEIARTAGSAASEVSAPAQVATEETIVPFGYLAGGAVMPISPLEPGTGYALEESALAQTKTEESSTPS